MSAEYPQYIEFSPEVAIVSNLESIAVRSAVYNRLSIAFVEVLIVFEVVPTIEDVAEFTVELPIASDLVSSGDLIAQFGNITVSTTNNNITVTLLPAVEGVLYPVAFRYLVQD